LTNACHVDLAAFGIVRADPNVFIPFLDPESSAAAEKGGLAGEFALQPVGMILGQRVGRLLGVRRDALGASDIDERVVMSLMSFFGDGADGIQLFGGIEKAFIAAGNVVVDFNTEDIAGVASATILSALSRLSP
jgi:hypothetical protein